MENPEEIRAILAAASREEARRGATGRGGADPQRRGGTRRLRTPGR
jgi:hypothetical protein